MACPAWHCFPTAQLLGEPLVPIPGAGAGCPPPDCPPGVAGSQQCPPNPRQGSGGGGEKAGQREGSP